MARILKSWDITAGGRQYHIELKPRDVIINNETYSLKQLPHVTKLVFFSEYQLPIEGADVRISCEMTQQLVVDNRIFGSDRQYEPLSSFPKWAYVLAVLHLGNLLNGAIGGALTALGIALTLSVTRRPGWSTAMKLLCGILILVGCYAAIFAIGLLFYLI